MRHKGKNGKDLLMLQIKDIKEVFEYIIPCPDALERATTKLHKTCDELYDLLVEKKELSSAEDLIMMYVSCHLCNIDECAHEDGMNHLHSVDRYALVTAFCYALETLYLALKDATALATLSSRLDGSIIH